MMRRVQDFVIACTVVAGVFGAQACAQQWWSDGPGGQFQTLQAYPDLQAMSVAFTPGSYIGVNLAEIDNERAKALSCPMSTAWRLRGWKTAARLPRRV